MRFDWLFSMHTGLPQTEAHAESIKWLKRAAELGHADAQFAYASEPVGHYAPESAQVWAVRVDLTLSNPS
jgi:TPR repeat protein